MVLKGDEVAGLPKGPAFDGRAGGLLKCDKCGKFSLVPAKICPTCKAEYIDQGKGCPQCAKSK